MRSNLPNDTSRSTLPHALPLVGCPIHRAFAIGVPSELARWGEDGWDFVSHPIPSVRKAQQHGLLLQPDRSQYPDTFDHRVPQRDNLRRRRSSAVHNRQHMLGR
jgi:hypothetical protein